MITMKFDSNLAWQQALSQLSANRAVLVPVAGVFFLLPSLVSVWFLSDFQSLMLANLRNPAAAEGAMQGMMGKVAGLGLLTFVVQVMGYMALLALLTDHQRPTVGEAIGHAARCLPALIGAALLAYLGLVLGGGTLVALVAALAAVTKLAALAVVAGIAAFVAFLWVLTRLSLTMPVIVIDGLRRPLLAMRRSWQLTHGNGLRILAFFILLGIGYGVLSVVFFMGLALLFGMGEAASGLPQAGTAAMVALGLVSGVVSAVVSVLFTGILASIHRQMAGPSAGAVSDTFA